MTAPAYFSGVEHLSTAILLLDDRLRVIHANPAAENLFGIGNRQISGLPLEAVFAETDSLLSAVTHARVNDESFTEHELVLAAPGHDRAAVTCVITPVAVQDVRMLLEFHPLEQQLKIAREQRLLTNQQANRELIRNLAHEIRNPLGGIRGAAQLLSSELPRSGLSEYIQVIIGEADRLQALLDRLLTPHKLPSYGAVNIHEVLERVRSLALAEGGQGIAIRRDYDISLPELAHADKEQLIQALLNIVKNAVQALAGRGEITLRTRAARQVTIAKRRHRLAMQVQIIDNGPGIPQELQDRIFYPLVSGREGGTGIGLSLAQTYINEHHGIIECESQPGRTCFSVLLPLSV